MTPWRLGALRIIRSVSGVRLSLLWLTAGIVLGVACAGPGADSNAGAPASAASAAVPAAASGEAGATRPEVVFLGDSLTAGLGLDQSRSFPSLIQQRLDERGGAWTVVNAGVSGDTSAGGLRRLSWALQDRPRVLVLALGANDGLRGLSTEELQKNLAAIIEGAQREGVAVVLAGMEAPPNNGPMYTARFRRVYQDLAKEYDVPLIPFLLEGVAGNPSLNQADGIHPNAEGARRLADTVWTVLEPVLAAAAAAR